MPGLADLPRRRGLGAMPADYAMLLADAQRSMQSDDPVALSVPEESPAEVAARRMQRSVRPEGGRQEGGATKVLDKYVPHVVGGLASLPQRALEASETRRMGGEYDPGPGIETALTVMGGTSFGAPAGAVGSGFTAPLYHGSPMKGLRALNESDRGPLGPGVYVTPAEQIAKGYYAGESGTVYQLPAKEREIYRGIGHRTDDEYFGWKADRERLIAAAEPDKQAAVADILSKMHSSDGYPAYQRLVRLYGTNEGAQSLFKRAGFEGISGLVDGPEVVLFGKQDISGTTLGSGATDKRLGAGLAGLGQAGERPAVTGVAVAKMPDESVAMVDPRRIDAAWQRDRNQYVGPDGAGGDPGKYSRAREFLTTADQFEAPSLRMNEGGTPVFEDGRHRFAVMRDLGMDRVPVAIDPYSAELARRWKLLGLAALPAGEAVVGAMGDQGSM